MPLRPLSVAIVLSLTAGIGFAADCTPDALDGTWRVTSLAQETLSAGAELTFAPEARLAAHLGCNRMMGGYTLAHGVIRAEALAMTRMACPDPLMARDQALATLLAAGAACRITVDGALHLGREADPDLTASR